jgi:hypothetical protein
MWRKTATYSASQPARHGFRMVNTAQAADFWLTVRRSGTPGLVPFFGETVPQTLEVGGAYKGRLATNDDAYYRASLPRGDYQAVLEFALQPSQRSNIAGSLSTLDASGGDATRVIALNEVDLSYRKAARFSVSRPDPVIFRVQNSHNIVGYLLRVEPAPAETATDRCAADTTCPSRLALRWGKLTKVTDPPPYLSSGVPRTWNFTSLLVVPLPPST